jgi:excisionase family DNA binding protein
MTPDILTPSQVAELFAVHPTTVKIWADKGLLVGFKTPGGHWRFRREDVDAALATGDAPSTTRGDVA